MIEHSFPGEQKLFICVVTLSVRGAAVLYGHSIVNLAFSLCNDAWFLTKRQIKEKIHFLKADKPATNKCKKLLCACL